MRLREGDRRGAQVALGTSSSTMPSAFASGAGTCRPVPIISSAGFGPISRGRRCVPPPPGMMPISTSGSPTFADGTAMRQVQHSAFSRPPPSA